MQGFCSNPGSSFVGGDTGYHRLVSPCLSGPGHGESPGDYGSAGMSAVAQRHQPAPPSRHDVRSRKAPALAAAPLTQSPQAVNSQARNKKRPASLSTGDTTGHSPFDHARAGPERRTFVYGGFSCCPSLSTSTHMYVFINKITYKAESAANKNSVVTSPLAESHGFPWVGSCGTPAAPTDAPRPKAEDAESERQNKHCGGVTNCLLPPAVNHDFPRGGSNGISIAVLSARRRSYGTTQVSRLCPTRTAMCVVSLPQMGHAPSFTLGVVDNYERIQAAVCRHLRLPKSWTPESVGHNRVHHDTVPLTSPVFPDLWGFYEPGTVQESGHYGCQPVRLWWNTCGLFC